MNLNKNIEEIQNAIRNENFDGWLFYDFANRDSLNYRILGLDEHQHTSRRWFYFIPATGDPQKICSKIESKKLDELPGKKHLYLKWQSLHTILKKILSNSNKIAMNYSPKNNIPYISKVDMGTGELIKSFGVKIVSSMNLIQKFEGLIDEKSIKSHFDIQPLMYEITLGAFDEIGNRLKNNEKFTEHDIQQWMINQFKKKNLDFSDGPPEVAVNEHAADPHFDSSVETSKIKRGDLVLIDSWAKTQEKDAIFYDFTYMAYVGSKIPPRIQEIWNIVRNSRDIAIEFEKKKFRNGQDCFGWEVDKCARDYIEEMGYGEFFIHRLGHSIGREVHGNAVHLDSLETQDERKIVAGVLHSIEPGIYIPEEKISIRTECDVYINSKKEVIVTGPLQKEIYKIEF